MESPDFSFGAWAPLHQDPDGAMDMPWYRPSPEAEAFLADLRALVTPIDWSAWASAPEGQKLIGNPAAVASATVDELGHLVTAYVRGDRFNEGLLAEAFDSGMLTAIARRASVLAEELTASS
jgi:hypothetical protein